MVTQSYSRVLVDIRTMTHEELEECYGIDIDDDGTVWDELEGIEHDDLLAWAYYCIEQEESDNTPVHRSGGRISYDE